jgi:branched-chain amino acid transport system substrate-binding protein
MRIGLMAASAALILAGPALAAEPTQGVSDTEITIGTYSDLSGVAAMWGVNNTNAIRMAFDEANAAGGVNGRKINYVVEDNQYQVPRSVQAINKLLNHDHVFITVANAGTPMNNATMPVQIEKGVANVFPLTAARSMYYPLNHYKFALGSSYYDQMRAGLKYFVQEKHKKTICAMSQDTDFGRDVMDGVRDELKELKMELVAETKHKPTDLDFTASVAKLRDAHCDLVLLGAIVRDGVQIISAIRKVGWDVDILGCAATYDLSVAEAPGGVTEGVFAMTPLLYAYPDDPRPKVREFAEKYKARFGKDPNFAAQVGYTGAEIVVAALQKSGKNLTNESFIAALESIKDYNDIFGSPTFSFGPEKHQASNESFLAVVKNGRWVPANQEPLVY